MLQTDGVDREPTAQFETDIFDILTECLQEGGRT